MWIEGVGEGDNGYAWRPQQGGPACFAKVDQAKTTRRDCLGPWLALKASPSSWAARNRGTLSIHTSGPTSPPRAFLRNVSIVLPFRLTSGPRNTSPYTASIRGDSMPGLVLPILAEYFMSKYSLCCSMLQQQYVFNSPKGELITYCTAEFKIARENRYI